MQTYRALLLCASMLAAMGWSAASAADNVAVPHQADGTAIHHDLGLPFGEPGKASKVDRVVTITMHDLSFEPDKLRLKIGETVHFVVKNVSTVDHDFTIGDSATQTEHRREMSEAMRRGAMHHHDSPNAIMVEPGKTRELIWKFTRAEKFEFDCNVPGHYEAGMRGFIVVSANNGK